MGSPALRNEQFCSDTELVSSAGGLILAADGDEGSALARISADPGVPPNPSGRGRTHAAQPGCAALKTAELDLQLRDGQSTSGCGGVRNVGTQLRHRAAGGNA